MISFFGDFILKVSIGLILIVINSTILHYISVKLKFKDHSFDNPTSISIIISILYIVSSYLPKFQLPFFIITNTAIPIVLAKEFYEIDWKLSIKYWAYWFFLMFILAGLLAIFLIIIL